jgi:hypothetical protein
VNLLAATRLIGAVEALEKNLGVDSTGEDERSRRRSARPGVGADINCVVQAEQSVVAEVEDLFSDMSDDDSGEGDVRPVPGWEAGRRPTGPAEGADAARRTRASTPTPGR